MVDTRVVLYVKKPWKGLVGLCIENIFEMALLEYAS